MNRHKAKKHVLRLWKEWRLTFFFIVFVVVPVKSSLADWNWVPTGSMSPTILQGDMIFVNKTAYDLRLPLTLYRLAKWSDPQRGDVVICFSPEDETRIVKRIIGQPGDTVELRNNRLFLNGRPLTYTQIDRQYTEFLSHELKKKAALAMEDLHGVTHPVMSTPLVPAMRSFAPVTIPQGYYFVMGDNRDNSKDSRIFGLVERKMIVGKAKGIIVSFDITDKYQPRLKRFFGPLK
ncbi:MAG: signal peptidase I [Planctomycetota bacterium]|jgi:signal peptidase I